MEKDFRSMRREIQKVDGKKQVGRLLSYDEAMDEVKEYLSERISEQMSEDMKFTKDNSSEVLIKNKSYLKLKKSQYRDYIMECITYNHMRIKDYDGDKIANFIEDMVDEFAGYSILEDAFADKEVSDIYVVDWETIFIEKRGVNQRYHKTFRSPKHFEVVLKRFLVEAGKEINIGDSKIVDFELYQDRGCAISPGVSPRGYSLTVRKHAEDHITRNELVQWNVMDEKISELLGMLVIGETNIICAGLTGSGKTTTIRALLDYYVTKSNKRMLVCEDTQELFPKNEHTLELISVKSDDPKVRVTLQELIFTALRLKPKYIVVGEVRGAEAEAAVEGMETGHSTIFTMHGGTAWNIVNRIVTKYFMAMPNLGIEIVERIIGSAVDYIFIQDNIPGIGRKITSLSEISYDFKKRTIEMKTIFRFDFNTQNWVWENLLGEDKTDKMLRRGIPFDALKPWMENRWEGDD